ncbi:hypothetical protein ABZ370_08780 [Streptomyces sp. NPDC005962]|uniref:hypothetical protein n=1 Tax=Streptomyces sp. NPDC005962 TaxID=3154466 RepID=UPI0033D34C8F
MVTADPPLRDSNPCAQTRLPKGHEAEDEEVFLEPEEYALLRAHLKPDGVDLVDALIGTGLRWGEVTAFQPRDFTFTGKRSTLRLHRAWKRRAEGGTYLSAPKTKKPRRTLALLPARVVALGLLLRPPVEGALTLDPGHTRHWILRI